MRQYYTYIMASRARTLYVGMTNDLARRVDEHKNGRVAGFTAMYRVTKLVYAEATSDARTAIRREKQVKGWTRAKKIALIEEANPAWEDLSADWYAEDAGVIGAERDPSLRSG